MSLQRFAIICLAALPLLTACDGETGPDEERFVATLSGANELPNPVSTSATGTAEFRLLENGTLSYTLNVAAITEVTMAHIHGPADATMNAGVIVWLYPVGATAPGTPTGLVNGQLAQGVITPAGVAVGMDSLLVLMRRGNAYVNVHTRTRGAGEIRGQINPR